MLELQRYQRKSEISFKQRIIPENFNFDQTFTLK